MSTKVKKAVRDSISNEESSEHRQLWLRSSITPSKPEPSLTFVMLGASFATAACVTTDATWCNFASCDMH